MSAARLEVDIWSDIACPWCSIGKRRFERALDDFGGEVAVTWRSFELDPAAPPVRPIEPYAEKLARKYGTSIEHAEGMVRQMTEAAAQEGLEFRFDRIRPGNTFDAHRLLHAAKEAGLQGAAKERFLVGYMTEGVAIGDPAELRELGIDAGLEPHVVDSVLADGTFAEDVLADEKLARELGISGVPYFVIDRAIGLSGAQAPEELRGALEEAMRRRAEDPQRKPGSR